MLTRFSIWFWSLLGYDTTGMYRFWDGRKWRRVDPLAIARAFWLHPKFDWDETPILLQAKNSTTELEGYRLIGLAVREVFDIPEPGKGGLPDSKCLDLLGDFKSYLGNVKKNGSLFPTLPQATEAESDPWDDLPFPTKPGSGYGSIAKEPSQDSAGFTPVETFGN